MLLNKLICKTQIFFQKHYPDYQNQSSVGASAKMPSKNKQQINKRTPKQEFVSNKATKQLDWKHTLVRVMQWPHTFRGHLGKNNYGTCLWFMSKSYS